MRTRTFAVLLTVALAIPSAAFAVPDVSPHAAEKIESARVMAGESATTFLQANGEGRGLDPERATGLERAAEVSQSWRFTGADKPGNGPKDSTRGSERSRQVHEALAAGLSPSAVHNETLDKPGREMARAFEGFKAKWDDHPGQGQGKGLGGPGGPDEDGDD